MDWSAFVGVPFRDRGRTLAGADCYGLFREAFRAGTGFDLPAVAEGYEREDRDAVARLVGAGKAAWSPVVAGSERPFDAVLMAVRGYQHIGLVVKRGWMLHMPRDAASIIEPYDTAVWQRLVTGFHRFAG